MNVDDTENSDASNATIKANAAGATDDAKVAITNCDLEPVHIPGRIQSFGALIAFDTHSMQINYCSDNLWTLFPDLDREILGSDLGRFSDNPHFAHAIRGALGLPTLGTTRERIGSFKIGDRLTDVAASLHEQTAVVELEPISPQAGAKYQAPIARLKSTLVALQSHQELPSLLQSATKSLRRMTGFDRVMVYKFLNDESGEVVAEARSPGVDSYLGLRYPASDIPKQVREMMVRVPFRLIADVDDPHAKVVSHHFKDPLTPPPLDLSMTHLRGVSPIHIQYLKNMGVSSTMNLSIVVHGKLWGLFAFHHYHPNQVGPNERSLCELFGHFASLEIQQKIQSERLSYERRTQSLLQLLRNAPSNSLAQCVSENAEVLMKTVNANGISFITEEKITSHGDVPSDAMIQQLIRIAPSEPLTLESFAGVDVTPIDSAIQSGEQLDPVDAGDEPAATDVAGVMMRKLSQQQDSWIAFFRNSVEKEIRWAGEKTKTVQHGPQGPYLSPRSSFAEYCEIVQGQSEPWTRDEHKTAAAIETTLSSLKFSHADELADQLRSTNQHQSLLISELNHRVRNIITLVRSIARQTSVNAQSLEDYVTHFEKRLIALATAHNLIGGNGTQWASLRKIINIELKAYRAAGTDTITIEGPEIAIAPGVVTVLTLVFHELATNAVKHGALSEPGIKLDISWGWESGGLRLVWAETVDRLIKPPQKVNFGLNLIQQALPSECHGECQLDFRPDGLTAMFWLPGSAIKALNHRISSKDDLNQRPGSDYPTRDRPNDTLNDAQSHATLGPGEIQPFRPLEVLILEDKSILAMEMQSMLQTFGFTDILTFSRIDALPSKDQLKTIEVAILDVDLGRGENSFEFASLLQTLGVPIIFTSGFDGDRNFPASLEAVPKLAKPVSADDLKAVITQVTGVNL